MLCLLTDGHLAWTVALESHGLQADMWVSLMTKTPAKFVWKSQVINAMGQQKRKCPLTFSGIDSIRTVIFDSFAVTTAGVHAASFSWRPLFVCRLLHKRKALPCNAHTQIRLPGVASMSLAGAIVCEQRCRWINPALLSCICQELSAHDNLCVDCLDRVGGSVLSFQQSVMTCTFVTKLYICSQVRIGGHSKPHVLLPCVTAL